MSTWKTTRDTAVHRRVVSKGFGPAGAIGVRDLSQLGYCRQNSLPSGSSITTQYARASAHIHVDVDTVLPGLRRVHPLEVYSRSLALRIHDRARGVPLLLWDAPRFQGVFPRLEFLRRVLQFVMECACIELRKGRRVAGIEDDLYRSGHEHKNRRTR